MAKKNIHLYSNENARKSSLLKLSETFEESTCCVVWLKGNARPGSTKLSIPSDISFCRALMVFEGLPVKVSNVTTWRKWAASKGAIDIKVVFADSKDDDEELGEIVGEIVKSNTSDWFVSPPQPEDPGVVRGTLIDLESDRKRKKDDPDLLTMMFGKMGELLSRVDGIRVRFNGTVGKKDSEAKRKHLKKIDALLKSSKPDDEAPPCLYEDHITAHLPRLLLQGETGTGKTLIARYLNDLSEYRPVRIVIPEYVNKEDMFEYALFGYARGNFTGGREEGSHGLLLENIGGVVFLDEIGEANATIQAKLLAYLDDYRVRPRGWEGEPFYCPTLVVAATNKPIDELRNDKNFRADLLARFTDVEEIPPLREREESLPFILDCLLQSDSINQDARVLEIGKNACQKIEKHPFKGNFRELEDVLRKACRSASLSDRNYIVANDLDI